MSDIQSYSHTAGCRFLSLGIYIYIHMCVVIYILNVLTNLFLLLKWCTLTAMPSFQPKFPCHLGALKSRMNSFTSQKLTTVKTQCDFMLDI